MFLLQQFGAAAFVAFAGAAMLLLGCGRWVPERRRRVLAPVAAAVAYLIGSWVLEGRPHLPPVEKIDWAFPIAVVAAFVAAALPVSASPSWSATLALLIAQGGATASLLLSGSLRLGGLSALASAVTAGVAVCFRTRGLGAVLLVPLALEAALVLGGYGLADLPPASALALVAAAALAALPRRWPAGRIVGALALSALAVAIALRASPPLDY